MNKFHFDIRQANVNDAHSIATIGYNSWHDTYSELLPKDFFTSLILNDQVRKCENKLKHDQNILVATDKDHYAVGYCSYGNSRNSFYYTESEIFTIRVSKEYRSKGLGGMLLFEAQKILPITKPIIARVLTDHHRARKFLESNEFKYIPDRDGNYRGMAPEVCYLKDK